MAVSVAIGTVDSEIGVFLLCGCEVTPERVCELAIGPGCAVLADDRRSARDDIPAKSTRSAGELRSAHAAPFGKGAGQRAGAMSLAHYIPGGQDYRFRHIGCVSGYVCRYPIQHNAPEKISSESESELVAAQS